MAEVLKCGTCKKLYAASRDSNNRSWKKQVKEATELGDILESIPDNEVVFENCDC